MYGLAAVVVANVWRLRGSVVSAALLRTDDGVIVSLQCDFPAFVQKLVVASVSRRRWRRIERRRPLLTRRANGLVLLGISFSSVPRILTIESRLKRGL